MKIKEVTVKMHLGKIFKKMKVKNRLELICKEYHKLCKQVGDANMVITDYINKYDLEDRCVDYVKKYLADDIRDYVVKNNIDIEKMKRMIK